MRRVMLLISDFYDGSSQNRYDLVFHIRIRKVDFNESFSILQVMRHSIDNIDFYFGNWDAEIWYRL